MGHDSWRGRGVKALLLAAGRGERLRPLTDACPKPMIEIGGKPILQHNVELLVSAGIRDIVINLHYLPGSITSHFGDGRSFGANIEYEFEPELLGTAGTARNVSAKFEREPFVVVYGDNLSTIDLKKMVEFHHHNRAEATIALFERPDATGSGIVSFSEDGRITRFKEKPLEREIFSNWVNAGYYVLEPSVIDAIPEYYPSDFGRDVFPRMLRDGARLYGYPMKERLWWIDSPADYERAKDVFPDAQ